MKQEKIDCWYSMVSVAMLFVLLSDVKIQVTLIDISPSFSNRVPFESNMVHLKHAWNMVKTDSCQNPGGNLCPYKVTSCLNSVPTYAPPLGEKLIFGN